MAYIRPCRVLVARIEAPLWRPPIGKGLHMKGIATVFLYASLQAFIPVANPWVVGQFRFYRGLESILPWPSGWLS
jgi:hypothetical protein